MNYFLQQLINGVTLGSIYGLIAIGYTMVFGIIGMVNFAHGDVFMLSTFIALIFLLALTQIVGVPSLALALFVVLVLGMLLTDGINGLWIARLIARADEVARVASRVMGLAVAGISLLVAAFGAAKCLSPAVETWSEGRELIFGFALVTVIAISFLVALRLTRRPLTG